jgi:hypothetical protein
MEFATQTIVARMGSLGRSPPTVHSANLTPMWKAQTMMGIIGAHIVIMNGEVGISSNESNGSDKLNNQSVV